MVAVTNFWAGMLLTVSALGYGITPPLPPTTALFAGLAAVVAAIYFECKEKDKRNEQT